jgi:precorrin-2 dehydrogenase/sirohydrochlorin ferrochelatase
VIKKIMQTYPVGLINLTGQRTIVVGGGMVASRKVKGLLDAGASVTLISPSIVPELEDLSNTQGVTWEPRQYRYGDLCDAFIVIAATNDPEVHKEIWEEAQHEGCLINIVDDPAHCNFIIPAQVRHGDFWIAISTGGTSPALARRLRERLEKQFGPEYGDFTALLGELRPVLLAAFSPGEARLNAAMQLVDSDLIEVLNRDGYEQAKRYALGILKRDVDHE